MKDGHQGGSVAAPVAGEIFGEVLPYLEVSKNQEGETKESVAMPGVTGLSLKEAKKILKEINVEYEIQGEIMEGVNESEIFIVDQLPKKGIVINTGTKVILKI